MRPSQLWKSLPADRRLALADAFWRDSEGSDVQYQHAEAAAILARRLNFRMKSVQALPTKKRARYLSLAADVPETVAMRALISYHMANQRPLMSAFLDALGIAHENGVIAAEQVSPPEAARIAEAVRTIRNAFPPEDVELYLRTLVAVDGDTWGGIDAHLAPTS